jgi:PAS domain S-box-containing protein
MLEPEPDVRHVTNLSAALRSIEELPPDLVLLDLADGGGLRSCESLRAAAPAAAIVVLSDRREADSARRAASAGAQDFLVKGGLDGESLGHALHGALERQRLVRELRDQEERFRGVVECLGEGLILTDFERMRYVNPRMLEIAGYRREEMEGAPLLSERFFAGDPRQLERNLRERRAGQNAVYEAPFRHADGSIRWLQVHAAPFRNARGQNAGSVLAFVDVTEHRATLEALRERTHQLAEAERRFRHMVAHLPAVLYSVTIEHHLRPTYVSDNAQDVLGFSAAEVLADPALWPSRVHPDDHLMVHRGMEALRASGGHTVEYRFQHKDGAWMWLEDQRTLVVDADGGPAEIVGVVTDISARRTLEDQLRQAQKMEAVGRLAGGIAHDFNNLLTAINGYSELALLALGPDGPASHEVQEIQRAGERAATLTRQLLAFSRRQVLQPRIVDLDEAVQGIAPLLRRLLGEDVRLETVAGGPGLRMRVDPGQLEQVVLNLSINARDAMPQGGRLTLTTGRRQLAAGDDLRGDRSAGDWVFLRVEDEGTGIAPDVLPHVFEPFFTTKETGKGTGLGLSTAYGIVRQSGGWIEVASQLGQGATFTVFLPHVEPESAVPASPAELRPANASAAVLVVEDEPAVRTLLCRTLRAAGLQVLEATGAAQALQLAAGQRIDLLVSDVVMPEMGGPALKRLLAESQPWLRTLLISGYDAGAVDADALGEGDGFLQKPFPPGELVRRVRALLAGQPD